MYEREGEFVQLGIVPLRWLPAKLRIERAGMFVKLGSGPFKLLLFSTLNEITMGEKIHHTMKQNKINNENNCWTKRKKYKHSVEIWQEQIRKRTSKIVVAHINFKNCWIRIITSDTKPIVGARITNIPIGIISPRITICCIIQIHKRLSFNFVYKTKRKCWTRQTIGWSNWTSFTVGMARRTTSIFIECWITTSFIIRIACSTIDIYTCIVTPIRIWTWEIVSCNMNNWRTLVGWQFSTQMVIVKFPKNNKTQNNEQMER